MSLPIKRQMTLRQQVDHNISKLDTKLVLGFALGYTLIIAADLATLLQTQRGQSSQRLRGSSPIYLGYLAALALATYQHYFPFNSQNAAIGLMRHLSENVLGEGVSWY